MNLKGQSAIEYLTTYGWMLLVVAIVGGSIFTTIQGRAQIQSVSGLNNAEVQVSDYGLNSEGLQLNLRAASTDQVSINEVKIENPDTGLTADITPSEVVPVGDTTQLSLEDVTESESTDTYNMKINYDTGGLEGLVAEGSIEGRLEIETNSWTYDVDGDGTDEKAEFVGSGTENSPLNIDSLTELQAINKNSTTRSYSYELTSNIDASPTSSWNGGKGFDPINSFGGSFNGNSHAITEVTIDRPSENDVALFSRVSSSGSLRNTLVKNVTVYGDGFTAGVVGKNSGSIKFVGVTGEVYGLQTSDALGVGGFVGDQDGTVTSSYSLADVYEGGSDGYQNGRAGGFQGQGKGTTKNSFSAGVVNTDDFYSGGFTGRNIGGSYENDYWDSENSGMSGTRGGASSLTTSEMTGSNAQGNMTGLDFQNTWKTVSGGYPELR